MDDGNFLRVQRELRTRLFEGPRALQWRPGRELAAEMLLYLDDPRQCWALASAWLLDVLDADRVDGGYGGFITPGGAAVDYVAAAESQRNGLTLPSVLGSRFDATDRGIHSVWDGDGVHGISCIAQDRSLSETMRARMIGFGTAAKLALSIRDGGNAVGMLCADWHREGARWHVEVCNQLGVLIRDALGPLLAAAGRLAGRNDDDGGSIELPYTVNGWADLTQAELKVARLIAHGLSYKEAARRLDRSVSTVDHQLRSIREKLGVHSTSRLVRLLNEHRAHPHPL